MNLSLTDIGGSFSFALTARKFGTTPRMRLVCLPLPSTSVLLGCGALGMAWPVWSSLSSAFPALDELQRTGEGREDAYCVGARGVSVDVATALCCALARVPAKLPNNSREVGTRVRRKGRVMFFLDFLGFEIALVCCIN